MSSSIDERTVRHVAHLSRLQFSDEEIRRLTGELSAILDYIEQLNRVDTADVEPTAHPVQIRNVFRDDSPRPSIDPAAALSNAPQSEQTFFRVPKVLDQDGDA
ncbi:MAG: Asp-tRNA(Asn)/Glu-tRNA(Gln) amidotransferase subunit GatC [bacterium]|nr:Asp-tRNA(Asn)/Glu-tRNA(Gln) amidotransferase subunit GatC [bacterium]